MKNLMRNKSSIVYKDNIFLFYSYSYYINIQYKYNIFIDFILAQD